MNTIEEFKEYELYPSLFDRIDRAFPELHFRKKGSKWESSYHLDGSKDSQNKDITFVYGNSKFMAIDHATDEKKGLIDLYMSLNGKDFIEALRDLAELCGLRLPNSDGEEWKEYEQRQADRETANEIFRKALWGDTEEALKVRSYLYSRKWTDEEIKKAELGLISPQVKEKVPNGEIYRGVVKNASGETIGGIGSTHLLTIPFRNGSRLLGFKFREVGASTGTKYLNSYGLQKSSGLFGIGIGVKDVVIVEGELDALHAQVRGATNVAATTGGRPTEAQIKDAVDRGVEKFTLLFDNDPSGRDFIVPTIEAIRKTGKSIFVASFLGSYKDTDEYLADNSIESLNDIINTAVPYSHFILGEITRRYSGEEGLTLKGREDFFQDIEKLLNSEYTKPYEREDIYSILKGYEDSLNFKVSDFREWADKAYYRQQERLRAEAVREASTNIQKAVEEGKTDEAINLMRKAAITQSERETATEYAKVFSILSPTEYATLLSEIKEGVPTGFKFEQGNHSEALTLNSGLTFICGYKGHGKTSFLNNIAINEARRNLQLGNGKSVLYFSYEVDKKRLIADLLNTFVNDPKISRDPIDTILSYFRGEGDRYFKNKNQRREEDGLTNFQHFENRKNVFLKEYLSTGAITIVGENYKVEKLLGAIKYYLSIRKVSIVCIDYAQLIYSEGYSRQRTEEIKKVVNDIKDFANKEGIPFVLAAQFNREVDSPISVDTKNIGEGGDFERIADTCIGLFNLKELHPLPKNKEEEAAAKKLLEDLGVKGYQKGEDLKPIEGKLFVRLMKRRYGYYPLDIILDWEGRTKYIKPNDEEALSAKPQQGDIFPENEEEERLPF